MIRIAVIVAGLYGAGVIRRRGAVPVGFESGGTEPDVDVGFGGGTSRRGLGVGRTGGPVKILLRVSVSSSVGGCASESAPSKSGKGIALR